MKELQRQREAGVDLKAGRLSLTEFATLWLNEVVGPRIKPKTFRFHQQVLEYYLLPNLGDTRIDQLRPEEVQRLLNRLRDDLSDRTVHHTHAVGKRVLDVAVKWGYLLRNPFAMVDPPRVSHEEREPLTPEQMRLLLAALEGHRLQLLYKLTLLLGFREGEVLGLRWADVDWDEATIKVTQQVQTVGGATGFETPKTKRSARKLPVPPHSMERLQVHRAMQGDERALAEEKWHEHDLIFPSEVGTPLQPRNLVRHYKATLKQVGIPTSVTFHDLRHTAATRLSDVGAGQSIIAAVLGHALPGVTGLYTHVDVAAMRPWVELAERRFFSDAS